MKSRSFGSGNPSRPSGSRFRTASDQSSLELLSDNDGSVLFGWVADGVLYTRFHGGMNAETGYIYATRLGSLVGPAQSICFFCDSSELKNYDLLARSAFARVILSSRRKFTSLVMLTWAEGPSASSQALAATLGEPIEILTSVNSFEARLSRQAPLVSRKLDPKTWVTVDRSTASTR
jgi:hypothetical protein